MRDEEHGYQDPRDQRGRDTWRNDDRNNRRFDYGGEERFGDRGWSGTSDQFAERDRSMFEHRGDRYGQRDDNYGNYGNRPFEMDRMRGFDDQSRGSYRDQDSANRERPMGMGRPFNDNDQDMYGQRGYSGQGGGYVEQGGGYTGRGGGYSGRGEGYSRRGEGYTGRREGYTGRSEGYSGQSRSYSGEGGQSGSQAGDMSSTMRGQHHGKGPSGFQRSDDRIKEMVCEALTDHGDIDATNIEVTVKAGEVTLTGTVEDRRMKRVAEECVENVRGVKDVQNQLRITPERQTGSSSTSGGTGASGMSTSSGTGTGGTGTGGTSASGTTSTGTGGSSGSSSNDKHDQADKKHRPS
ncbi:MAG TPA: BON domain-containing protein [Kofleriaceae bacterium]|nr:BON domain-containing protein [Kofleriaceae bacterium]